jgi:tetratricopeptide (TPR) repeat protein
MRTADGGRMVSSADALSCEGSLPERKSLELALETYPDRSDLKRRLCYLRLQSRESLTDDEIRAAFPEYDGPGTIYSFIGPLYLKASELGDADHLELPVRVLHELFPDCPCCVYFRARWFFNFGDPRAALDVLNASRSLTPKYDYLAALHLELLKIHGQDSEARRLVEDARKTLEWALEVDPGRSDLKRRLCRIRLEHRETLTEDDICQAFPHYTGPDDIQSFMGSLFLAAHDSGDANHLELPLRVLHEQFPDCPSCLYFRARWLYNFGDPQSALDLLDASRSLTLKHDYLAALHAQVLQFLDRRDEAQQLIQDFFRDYKGDLWRTPQFRILQEDRIKKHIPPLLVITLPKSGSVFLLNTLSKGLSIPHTYLCPLGFFWDMLIEQRLSDFVDGGALSVDHILPTRRSLDVLHRHGINRLVFHYRDVRQSALSYVHHSFSNEIHTRPRRDILNEKSRSLEGTPLFAQIYTRLFHRFLPYLEGWLDVCRNDRRFDILLTNFDDLRDERQLMRTILNFFDIDEGVFQWNILDSSKKERAGHFRKGLADEWRDVLPRALQREIDEILCTRPVLQGLDEIHAAQESRRS